MQTELESLLPGFTYPIFLSFVYSSIFNEMLRFPLPSTCSDNHKIQFFHRACIELVKAVRIDSSTLDSYLDRKEKIKLRKHQLKELEKWKRIVEKGGEIPLFSEDERKGIEQSADVIEKEERKSRKRAYREEKKRNPTLSKREFKKEWIERMRMKEEERRKVMKEKSHYFAEKPSKDRIMKRIDHWEKELEELEEDYEKEVRLEGRSDCVGGSGFENE